MIVDNVRIQSETARWVTLEIHKGCLVVLTRAQFVAGLKKGKAWRRAAAMRARQPDVAAAADRRRRAREVLK